MDAAAIHEHGIPGAVLMKRAGRVCFEALLARWPEPEAITVFCGGGNNGGDGYVVAALAKQAQIPVSVIHLVDPDNLKGDAARAYHFARQEGVPCAAFDSKQALPTAGVIVDALLGTGLSGQVRADMAAAIGVINQAGLPVLAVDIASGIDADTGAILGAAVQAQVTCTFIGAKVGLFTGAAPGCCGELVFADLEVPAEVLAGQHPVATRLELADLLQLLSTRSRVAHKGDFGHVLVMGGDLGFGGAALMTAEASARLGAGLTSLATRPENTLAMNVRCPEVMAASIRTGVEVTPLLEKATVIAVGPGLGRQAWSQQLLLAALESFQPLVLDADALNLIADGVAAVALAERQQAGTVNVMTPHPGEAARLLSVTTAEVQADRLAAAKRLAEKYSAVVVLKGAGTVIAEPGGQCFVCTQGNPGMASGGMGDVLTGMVASLLAQGLAALPAAQLAVCLHAQAADEQVARYGERGLLATDLIPAARALLNGL